MPHTSSRYQQDLGFSDGLIDYSLQDIVAISVSGTAPSIVRNAIGDIAYSLAASSQAYFDIDLMKNVLRRSGFFEDTQNEFGSTFGGGLGGPSAGPSGLSGTGIPASAAPQGRPPDYILPGQPQPMSAMGALQEITPRTAFKIKGVKPTSLNLIYKVLTGAMTTLTVSLTQTVFKNGQSVVTGQTTLLAAGLNGLVNAAAATPYVTNIAIPNAVFYQITPLTELWLEIAVTSPAGNTFQLYGCEMNCVFNYN
jgi:hypothetical protein